MSRLTFVPANTEALSEVDEALAASTANYVREVCPDVVLDSIFHHLVPHRIGSRPALHCDDFSEVMRPPHCMGNYYLQERARLRAVSGDWIATTFQKDDAYDDYCTRSLGLGDIHWLQPDPISKFRTESDPHHLAEACWEDRQVRNKLLNAVKHEGLRYLHPHYGTKAIWELALLLQKSGRNPVHVIGAPPGLATFVNDKGQFAKMVEFMYGPTSLPATEVVWNTAHAAEQLRELCERRRRVSIKLPSSAGGQGNLLFNSAAFQGRSLAELRQIIMRSLPRLGYQNANELVVSVWEENVLVAPSAQFWIPPPAEGTPIFEGLFMQFIVGEQGEFTGSTPADLPASVRRQAEVRCSTIALAFQKLGYLGRCSFDLLLIGESDDESELQFIECNGRWGGTSIPMTLMNRLFRDWHNQPFAANTCQVKGAGQIGYAAIHNYLADWVYEPQPASGQRVHEKIILLDPERLKRMDEITAICLTDSWPSAIEFSQQDFPKLIEKAIAEIA